MLMGALIGGVAGLVVYFIQQQQKKKQEAANENLDANMSSETASTEENKED